MKIKKVLILMTILVTCSVRWPTIVLGQQEKEQSQSVEQLQEKVNELEKTIKAQQQTLRQARMAYERAKKQLDEQIQENERLLALCEKNGIQTAKPEKTSFKSGEIIYRGKKRDMRWFNAMYEKFYDKIACVDNTYFNISEALLKFNTIEPHHMVWPVGSPVRVPYNSSVLSVVKEGQVLISNREATVIFHIHGLEGSFVDGQDFLPVQTLYIYTGTFDYATAIGGKKTVPSLAIYKPLTKEQFADALNSGYILTYPSRGRRTQIKTVP